MKKKTKKALIILACVIVVLVVGGHFAYTGVMNYVGDKAMSMLIENQIESMLDSGDLTFEELEEIIVADPITEEVNEAQASPTETPAQSAPKEEKPKPSAPSASTKTATEKKETVKEASQKVTDSISREEKQAMMKLIASRLTKADIQYAASLAAGGLEGEEISKAYRLAKSRFSAEELEQVRVYWHRYKSAVLKPRPKAEEKK